MTQLNTPYPTTAYLTGFLRSRGIDAVQEDLALALVLELFSPAGLQAVRECIAALPADAAHAARRRLRRRLRPLPRHHRAHAGLPAGPRPDAGAPHRHARLPARRAALRGAGRLRRPRRPARGGDPLAWAFGALGVQDRARHLATLYLNDLADVLRDAVDPRFEFVRYAESLAQSQPTFDPLAAALAAPPTLVDRTLQALTLRGRRHATGPTVVLVSVPFPGTVYGAFRIAQAIKARAPGDRASRSAAASSTPSCAN